MSKPLLLLIVLLVLVAASLGTVFTLGWYFPTQVAIVSQGEFELQVPLMALYTAPNATGLIAYSTAYYHFATSDSESTNFQFSWSLAAHASLPVEFSVQIPPSFASNFRSLGGGSFAYWPLGTCSVGCGGGFSTGIGGVSSPNADAMLWRFNYTVRLMSRLAAFGGLRFLEVDLRPVDGAGMIGGSFSDIGVASPSAADLAQVGSLNVLGADYLLFSTNDSAIHDRTFGYRSGPVSLEAGDQGPLSAQLTSTFRWSSVDWEEVSFWNSGAITLREYVDLRFGSINLSVEPYVGP
ncbi:MAG TPA: hypothetical protein HA326_00165 [Thermoplasmata archaeon]|nr:hypothetical protein [Thermoplasmata archaeon]